MNPVSIFIKILRIADDKPIGTASLISYKRKVLSSFYIKFTFARL
uniref:Uncharacterized protein n=1 Tax=Anguilla anguilla TaxID=7936 RepID=A0A0E9T995_ANGAN